MAAGLRTDRAEPMRVAIPHNHPRAEVRSRVKARSHEIADFIPGGLATVTTDWPSDDRMALYVSAMGQRIDGAIDISDTEMVITIDLPPALSFVESMIHGTMEEKGRKLLR